MRRIAELAGTVKMLHALTLLSLVAQSPPATLFAAGGRLPSAGPSSVASQMYDRRTMCGLNALYMYLRLSDVPVRFRDVENTLGVSTSGHSLLQLRNAARSFSVRCDLVKCDVGDLDRRHLPAIAFAKQGTMWSNNGRIGHFYVVVHSTRNAVHYLDGTTAEEFTVPPYFFMSGVTGHFITRAPFQRGTEYWILGLVGLAACILLRVLWSSRRLARHIRVWPFTGRCACTVLATCASIAAYAGEADVQQSADGSNLVWREARADASNALYVFLAYHNAPVSYAEIATELQSGRQTSLLDLQRCSSAHGVESSIRRLTPSDIAVQHLPAVTLIGDARSTAQGFAVITSLTHDTVRVISPGLGQLEEVPMDEFRRRWSGVILCHSRGHAARFKPIYIVAIYLPLGMTYMILRLVVQILWRRRVLATFAACGSLFLSNPIGAQESQQIPESVVDALRRNATGLEGTVFEWKRDRTSALSLNELFRRIGREQPVIGDNTFIGTERAVYKYEAGRMRLRYSFPKARLVAKRGVILSAESKLSNQMLALSGIDEHVSDVAFDGRNFYRGVEYKSKGRPGGLLIESLDEQTNSALKNSMNVVWLRSDYLRQAGFKIPSTVAELRSPRIQSLALHYLENGWRPQRVEHIEGKDGVSDLEIALSLDLSTVVFQLASSFDNAITRRDEYFENQRICTAVLSDHVKLPGSPSVWLPRTCNVTYYQVEGLPSPPSRTVLLTEVFTLERATHENLNEEAFVASYATPGVIVADGRLPNAEASADGLLQYTIPADPSRLDEAIERAIQGHPPDHGNDFFGPARFSTGRMAAIGATILLAALVGFFLLRRWTAT